MHYHVPVCICTNSGCIVSQGPIPASNTWSIGLLSLSFLLLSLTFCFFLSVLFVGSERCRRRRRLCALTAKPRAVREARHSGLFLHFMQKAFSILGVAPEKPPRKVGWVGKWNQPRRDSRGVDFSLREVYIIYRHIFKVFDLFVCRNIGFISTRQCQCQASCSCIPKSRNKKLQILLFMFLDQSLFKHSFTM